MNYKEYLSGLIGSEGQLDYNDVAYNFSCGAYSDDEEVARLKEVHDDFAVFETNNRDRDFVIKVIVIPFSCLTLTNY